MITLQDITLKEYTLEKLPLVKKLREKHFASDTEVCIERAELMTNYLRTHSGNKESPQLMRAKAINHYLSKRQALFLDDNLLGGSTTSKLIGAPLYPEFMGLSIWPELDTISTRKSNPQILTSKEADTCNFEIFPYWMDKTVMEITRKKFDTPLSLQLLEKIVYYISGKAGCISHCVPNYSRIINEGAEAIINEAAKKEKNLLAQHDEERDAHQIDFYKSVQVALQGIINYAQNLADEANK